MKCVFAIDILLTKTLSDVIWQTYISPLSYFLEKALYKYVLLLLFEQELSSIVWIL